MFLISSKGDERCVKKLYRKEPWMIVKFVLEEFIDRGKCVMQAVKRR